MSKNWPIFLLAAAAMLWVLTLPGSNSQEAPNARAFDAKVFEANKTASRIAHSGAVRVVQKKMSLSKTGEPVMAITLELSREDSILKMMTFHVNDYHRFYLQFQKLLEGESASFLHMPFMGGDENPGSYLAPNCPEVERFCREHYDY